VISKWDFLSTNCTWDVDCNIACVVWCSLYVKCKQVKGGKKSFAFTF